MKTLRCPGCGCMEPAAEFAGKPVCDDCTREILRRIAEDGLPKSWQQQLANAENPEL